MKTGIRKPSVKKSISARTTGKVKRAVKKSVNPVYGKKGAGFVKNPTKSVKNSIYHKTTVGVSDITKSGSGSRTASGSVYSGSGSSPASVPEKKKGGASSIIMIFFGVIFLIGGFGSFSTNIFNGFFGLIVGGVCLYFGIQKRRNIKQDADNMNQNT